MPTLSPRGLLAPVLLVTGFLAACGCDRVKRETTDRVVPYEASAWTSRSDCEDTLAERAPVSRAPRIATWNIRYFPDSQEAPQPDEDAATDVEWLSCAITSLDVDILVVQEFKTTEKAVVKQQELIQRLNERTGGDWQLQLASCDPDEVQHPGFLYDATRVTGSQFRDVPVLNPDPVCSNNVSPGFAGYFSINGGPDFHLVSIHFAAGNERSAMERRAYSFDAMSQVVEEAYGVVADTDIIFTGDFNTSGCPECDPAVQSLEEVTTFTETVGAQPTPLTVLPSSQPCSREDGDDSPLLDHFAVAASMSEVPGDAIAQIGGICEESECSRLHDWHEDARQRLSDHCPVVLDLNAVDADE